MPWVVVTQGAKAAGAGAKKGLGAAAKGVKKGVGKAGRTAKDGAQKGAKKAAQTGRKGAQKAGQAGKDRVDPRKARNRAPFGRDGKSGSSGSGDKTGGGKGGSGGKGGKGGRGLLGGGGKAGGRGGWGGKARDAALGGRGGRGAPGQSGGEATDGPGDGASQAADAARNFIRNRLRMRRGPLKKTRSRLNRLCLIILALLLVVPFLMGMYGADASSDEMEAVMAMQCSGAPVELMSEETEIPVEAVAAYCSAAVEWEINWAVLAAIGKLECDHGRSTLPGCDREGPLTVNDKGARGPMQFLGSTWRSSADDMDIDVAGEPIPRGQENAGYATDSEDPGTVADPWSWPDATHAAARYLLDNGFADDQNRAIFAYNNSQEYVDDVQELASEYQSQVTSVMDDPELAGGGGGAAGGGAAAVGPCPWPGPDGSTAPVPAGRNTPATRTMANTLIECFGRNGKGVGCYDPRPPAGLYEHPRGRACDFMMTSGGVAFGRERARGLAMAQWAQANADELKILYVIWYNRIWFRGRDPDRPVPWSSWRSYGCGGCGPSGGHFNHVHVSVKLQPGDPPLAHCPHSSCTE